MLCLHGDRKEASNDVAKKLKLLSPCSIIGKFIPPLVGIEGKMSSSVSKQSTIFLTDDENTIRMKINKFAFSGAGGNGSLEDHRKYGGNVDIDIPCQYLKFFEMDDEKLNDIFKNFKEGKLTCGETKKILGDIKLNLETGIYGQLNENISKEKILPVANFDEVEIGNAEIITTLSNNKKESGKKKF